MPTMGKHEQPDLNEIIYQLYEHAALKGPVKFRAEAAESISLLLKADAVCWGIQHKDSPVPSSLWRQRVKGSFLADIEPPDWQSFVQALFDEDEDGAAVNTINLGRGGLGQVPALREQFRDAGIGQVLAMRCPHPARPIHSLILLLRKDGQAAFNKDELESMYLLAPHLGGAMTLALRGLASIDQLLQSLGRPSRHSSGVLDDRGVVLEADDLFRTLLNTHFPDWRGGRLPFPLPPLDGSGTEEPVVASLHVRGTRSDGLTVVHLREVNPMDLLSPRERDVVRAIASGVTLKTIGKRLGISSSTVANHAARIYAKLGIHSRDKLVEMLKRLNRNEAKTNKDDKAG